MSASTRQQDFPVDADTIARHTLELIREPSLSGDEARVASLVEQIMRRLGFSVEVDRLGNVTGTFDAGPGPCVLLDAHMDTVGVSTPSAWQFNPAGELVDGRIYGRGASDMKGALVAALHGGALAASAMRTGRVVVSATVAEEFAEGFALIPVAETVRPDTVIICEASALAIAVGQRGRAELRVEVRGVPTHSSRPDLGVNAAEAMADVILGLRSLELPSHAVLGDALLVLTDVASYPQPALSVVPDRCVAVLDRRTLPDEEADAIVAAVQAVADEAVGAHGATARVEIVTDDFTTYTGATVSAPNFAPAWIFDRDAAHIVRAASGLIVHGMTAAFTHYSFCTNGSGSAAQLGVPTLGFGPGDPAMAHRNDECIDVSSLAAAARGYAAMTLALTDVHG